MVLGCLDGMMKLQYMIWLPLRLGVIKIDHLSPIRFAEINTTFKVTISFKNNLEALITICDYVLILNINI